MNPLLISLLQAVIANPQLLGDLVAAIEGIFHHPTVQPNLPTPLPPAPFTPSAPLPPSSPAVPAVFVPQPGKLAVLGAKSIDTDQPVVPPYKRNTHIHFDHNLLNNLPWPEGSPNGTGITPWSPTYVWTWDGALGGGGDTISPGSMDKDGYAGRFNIVSLHDTNPHTLAVALQLTVNGQTVVGPFISFPVQQA